MAWLLLGAWSVLQALSVAGVAAYGWFVPRNGATETAPGVVAIVPVRGPAPLLGAFVAALLAQSAPLRAVFVVQSRDDPAWPLLDAWEQRRPDAVQLVVAGPALAQGQKVHNLLAGIAALTDRDRVLVFLDADMLPGPQLVGRLLFPLVRGKAAIATGYRWLVPGTTAASWLGAAINLQVATFPRLPGRGLPWGGATAMTRDTFERLDLAREWQGALSDDLTLARVARARGIAVRTVTDLLLPSPAEAGLRGLWRFGVRQYRHVFWNLPRFWVLAAAVLGLQGLGWAWALSAGGRRALAIGYGAAAVRAALRIGIARRLPQAGRLRAVAGVAADVAVPFVVCGVHLLMVLAAAASRRIRWAGTDYWMARGKVRAMRRQG